MSFFTKRYHPPGTPAGTLSSQLTTETARAKLFAINYNAEEFEFEEGIEAKTCSRYLNNDKLTWVHVQGQPDMGILNALGEIFDLHALALEDVQNSGQRPKIEAFEDQLFIVMNLPQMHEAMVEVHQVSIFLSQSFIVSFCQGDFTPFKPILNRLQDKHSRLRNKGIDFLLYSVIDLVIDQGFPVLEEFGLQLEELEEQIMQTCDKETLATIHTIKRELILLRRTLWPQREVVNQLLRDEHPLIHADSLIYLRDCYDHTIQVMDLLETYRDMTGSMLDIYLSSVSNRMNDVMRVLTVIATTFIPLTFIVGLYGMNFDRKSPYNLPELSWTYGYPLVWILMIVVAVAMLAFFRRRGWF